MSNHTPGPWRVLEYRPGYGSNRVGLTVVAKRSDGGHLPYYVARMEREASLDEERANAELIASAPDLLAERDALRAVLRSYVAAYPAFRIKPIGAPGSKAREEQELLMALEERAQKLLECAK